MKQYLVINKLKDGQFVAYQRLYSNLRPARTAALEAVYGTDTTDPQEYAHTMLDNVDVTHVWIVPFDELTECDVASVKEEFQEWHRKDQAEALRNKEIAELARLTIKYANEEANVT